MKIFLVEDDVWYSEMLRYHLELNPDFEVVHFATGEACLLRLYERPDVISLDYSLPDIEGVALMKKIKAKHPKLPVIILSGQEDIGTAIQLLKAGAEDYIIKNDESIERLRHSLQKVQERGELLHEIANLQEEVGKKYAFGNVIKGKSPQILRIFHLMGKAAGSNITVSVTGETGTGKELVARSIHFNSERSKKAFVPVNVAAIPSELVESELFGHEKGAFTGASGLRIGKFEEANGGTLFLDEIGEMDTAMQAKVLRVLQERELVRVGGSKPVKLDFRLIIATHKNLMEEVREKRFREDLYYRLLGLSIELPPLRERQEDIPMLAQHFLQEYAKDNRMTICRLSQEAMKQLLAYSFPGNIRELRAVMELATVLCQDQLIQPADLQLQHHGLMLDLMKADDTLKGYTRKIVMHYLEKYNQDIDLVASKLDIGRSTIYKMKKDGELSND